MHNKLHPGSQLGISAIMFTAVVIIGGLLAAAMLLGAAVTAVVDLLPPAPVSVPTLAPPPVSLPPSVLDPAPEPVVVHDPVVVEAQWRHRDRSDRWRRHREARRVFLAACCVKQLAKLHLASTANPLEACAASFVKSFAVQVQVAALADLDQVSRHPPVAFAQGFLMGL